MGYNKETYEVANRLLEQRRKQAVQEADTRRNRIYQLYPRVKEIERELSSTAITAARAVLAGQNAAQQLETLKVKNLSLQSELSSILNAAGVEPDYLDTKFQCSYCKDEGYVDGVMCSCLKQLLRQEAYRQLNQLSPLALSSFESFSLDFYSDVPVREGYPAPRKRMEGILGYCKGYAADFSAHSPSLLMQGATGLGKTHLSLAIARVAINKGFGVISGSTQNIISKLEKERFSYRRNRDDIDSEQHLIECDLLILDDLGTEFSTGFSSAAIYNVLNSRLLSAKPTIISTNLTMRELERSYSERLVSRIMGNHVRLEFLGNDIRQQKRMQSHR